MFRVPIYICWQTENKKTSVEQVLNIVQSVSSEDSRILKAQEKKVIFSEARLIEDQAQPIENCKKIISIEF